MNFLMGTLIYDIYVLLGYCFMNEVISFSSSTYESMERIIVVVVFISLTIVEIYTFCINKAHISKSKSIMQFLTFEQWSYLACLFILEICLYRVLCSKGNKTCMNTILSGCSPIYIRHLYIPE